jgi:hypothetical protein
MSNEKFVCTSQNWERKGKLLLKNEEICGGKAHGNLIEIF